MTVLECGAGGGALALCCCCAVAPPLQLLSTGLPWPVHPCRLLGAGVDFGAQTDWGRWRQGLALDPAGVRPWLFVAQQKRLSCREMEVYGDHVAAQGEVDEDSDALWFS